jgi:epsilon-lactone hydrolase
LTAYDLLLKQGIPAERIVVAGDSAGGNLGLSLILLNQLGKPMPGGAVLFSP